MWNKKCMYDVESMLANMDKVMRQFRQKTRDGHFAGRGTYRFLNAGSKAPGLSTKELAEIINLRCAFLNEKLMRLENEGMIKRERDEDDQLICVVHLESASLDYLFIIQGIRSKKNQTVSALLSSEEIHELARFSEKLASALKRINNENKENELNNKKMEVMCMSNRGNGFKSKGNQLLIEDELLKRAKSK